jgi:hypothetical protein
MAKRMAAAGRRSGASDREGRCMGLRYSPACHQSQRESCFLRQGLTWTRTRTMMSGAIACCKQRVGETASCPGAPPFTSRRDLGQHPAFLLQFPDLLKPSEMLWSIDDPRHGYIGKEVCQEGEPRREDQIPAIQSVAITLVVRSRPKSPK